MRHRRRKAVLALVLATALALSWGPSSRAAGPLELFVDPTGNDANTGTSAAPVKTLEGARNAVRRVKTNGAASGGVLVSFRSGVYQSLGSVEFAAEDSGTAQAPIVYRAAAGATVELTGSMEVPAAALKPVTDAGIAQRLPEATRASVREVNLAALGVDPGTPQPAGPGNDQPAGPTFIQAGSEAVPARYPNDRRLTITEVVQDGANPIWRFDDARPGTWREPNKAWVFGYPAVDWGFQTLPVQSVDAGASTVRLGAASAYGSLAGQSFHFYNVLEELDRANEFVIDRSTGKAYVIPGVGDLRLTTVSAPLISGRGASHLEFRGLQIAHTRGDGIRLDGGTGNTISGNRFVNIGLRAATVTNAQDSRFLDNLVDGTGAGGLLLSGGDRTTLSPGNNVADGNRIRDYQRLYPSYSAGIEVAGVGQRVVRNEILDAPHLAIHLRGNDHLIENNYIHHVVQDSTDAGAIYAARDWTERGTVIRNNVITDVGAPGGKDDVVAVYLDDMISGVTVEGNLIANVPRGVQHSGRDNVIRSNVFINTVKPVYIGFWSDATAVPGGELEQRLAAVPYQSGPWLKYPNLANLMNDEHLLQKYNVVSANAHIGGALDLTGRGAANSQYDKNVPVATDSIGAGPGYVIEADSPIRAIPGMQPIDMSCVGPAGIPVAPTPSPTPTATPTPTPNPSPSPSATVPSRTEPGLAVVAADAADGDRTVAAAGTLRVASEYWRLDTNTDYTLYTDIRDVRTGAIVRGAQQKFSTLATTGGTLTALVTLPGTLSGQVTVEQRLQHAVGHFVANGRDDAQILVGSASPPITPSPTPGPTPAPTPTPTPSPTPPPSPTPTPIPSPTSSPTTPAVAPWSSASGPAIRIELAAPAGGLTATMDYRALDRFTDYGIHATVVDAGTGKALAYYPPTRMSTGLFRDGTRTLALPFTPTGPVRVTLAVQHAVGHFVAAGQSPDLDVP